MRRGYRHAGPTRPGWKIVNLRQMLFFLLRPDLIVRNWKAALLVCLLMTAPILVGVARRKRLHYSKAWALVIFAGTLAFLAPIDLQLQHIGRLSVDLVPIVWGLPGASAFKDANEGKVLLGGCRVPYNASGYTVIVSY